MTVITKPLSQQEKDQKAEVKDDTPMEEVSLSGEEKPTETKITVIRSPNRYHYMFSVIWLWIGSCY